MPKEGSNMHLFCISKKDRINKILFTFGCRCQRQRMIRITWIMRENLNFVAFGSKNEGMSIVYESV